MDGFLGAAGGGLIWDMIFRELGIIGGAMAGYIGGEGLREASETEGESASG